MKLFTAALGCLFLNLVDAQPHCALYFTSSGWRVNGKIWAANKTSADPYLLKEEPDLGIKGIEYDKTNGRLFYSTSTQDESYLRDVRAMGVDGTGDAILPMNTDDSYGGALEIALDAKNGRIFGGVDDFREYLFMGSSDGNTSLERLLPDIFFVKDIVYDPETDKVFFAGGGISFAEVPVIGSPPRVVDMELDHSDDYRIFAGLDVDTAHGYVYWTTERTTVPGIFRAPSDGSGTPERLYTVYDFDGARPDKVRIDKVNQILYITTDQALYMARADGRGVPQLLYDMSDILVQQYEELRDLVLDCDGSRDGLPLLSQCSSKEQCFFNGVCTARVGKPKKCRFCARKNQVCESVDECCQSPSGRYCHPVEKVCKRQPKDDILDFVQCPAGTAFSSIADTGNLLSVSQADLFNPYDQNEEFFVEAVSLPFDFPWFGTKVNKTYVTYQGILGMVEIDNPRRLPWGPIAPGGDGRDTVPRISVTGDGSNARVYSHQSPRSVTISWEDGRYSWAGINYGYPTGEWNAQATLFDDGRVVLCWGHMEGENIDSQSTDLRFDRAMAGIEDDSLGYAKPAVIFPNNPFDEFGRLQGSNPDLSGKCACFG